ncbi:MFS transporter [Nocardia tenerifensis]|uniref:MFS transporter n=1 Tax=Nocardia tenerifensis TaxID=228006 RepID=A0A318K0C1_9NOCA|nr:MFS transporter [Nocardia tenerifensis]PXX61082.1 MFS transporter [Nocardia tenerifensis]
MPPERVRTAPPPTVDGTVPGSPRRWLALAVVLTGQFMSSMDTTVGNIAAPSIQQDLGIEPGTAALAVTAYTLTYASMLITGARLGSDRGRRRLFLIGIAVFTVSSVLIGSAPDAVVLIGARAVQGLGAAMAVPQAISFIQADFVGKARTRALAAYGAMISIGATSGLAIGGALISLDVFGLGWRTVFLINLPIGVAVLAGAARLLPEIAVSPRRLDLAGVGLLTVGAASITGALALGPDTGWSGFGWAVAALGVAVLAVFVAWQRIQLRRNGAPLLDLSIMAVPGMRPGLIALLLSSTTYTGVLFCVAADLQDQHGHSAAAAGLALVPFAIGFGIGSAPGSLVPHRRHLALTIAGLAVLGGSLILMGAIEHGDGLDTGSAAMLLAVAGFGYGACFTPMLGLTVAHVRPGQVPDATGIATTTFQFSFVLGVAAFGSLYTSTTLAFALVIMGALACAAIVPAAMIHPINN